MNPIERLREDLVTRFPGISAEVDAPADEAGRWHLDVRPGGGSPWIVVEWKTDLGFGVSTPGEADFGMKPDELYPNGKAAYGRVVQLILSGGRTEPPAAVRLAELRQARGLSQAEVAGHAGIKQAAIARIEGRDDILLSTLNRVVAAMGGRLSIRAEFPDGTARELTGLISPRSPVWDEETPSLKSPALPPPESPSTRGIPARSAQEPVARRLKERTPEIGINPDIPEAPVGRPSQGRGKSVGKLGRKATGKGETPRS